MTILIAPTSIACDNYKNEYVLKHLKQCLAHRQYLGNVYCKIEYDHKSHRDVHELNQTKDGKTRGWKKILERDHSAMGCSVVAGRKGEKE